MTKFEEMIEKNPAPPTIEFGEVPGGEPVTPLAQLLAELDEIRADRI